MPLHLDAVSRRRFLRGSAVLALTAATNGISATVTGTETWALLSDTHIDHDPAKISRQGVNMAEHLRRVVAEILAEKETLAGVILNGDCAFNDGQAGDYTLLLDLFDPLAKAGIPLHFTLGNHDDREVFRKVLGNTAGPSSLAAKHCSLLETPSANLILLDSLRHVNKVEGEIGTEQLAWLGEILRAAPDKPAIVIAHHYPQAPPSETAEEKKPRVTGLVDTAPFLELLRTHRSVKAYLYGHSHNWRSKEGTDGLHEVNLPPTAYVFDEARPNGWVRATLSATGMALELRALDPAHSEHGKVTEFKWR